jgi:hypothetical protein
MTKRRENYCSGKLKFSPHKAKHLLRDFDWQFHLPAGTCRGNRMQRLLSTMGLVSKILESPRQWDRVSPEIPAYACLLYTLVCANRPPATTFEPHTAQVLLLIFDGSPDPEWTWKQLHVTRAFSCVRLRESHCSHINIT